MCLVSVIERYSGQSSCNYCRRNGLWKDNAANPGSWIYDMLAGENSSIKNNYSSRDFNDIFLNYCSIFTRMGTVIMV